MLPIFLPASQIDFITPRNLAQFVNNTYEFKVVKINQERQNIVLSRRELIEQERNEKRAKLLAEMVPGDIRKGTRCPMPTRTRDTGRGRWRRSLRSGSRAGTVR